MIENKKLKNATDFFEALDDGIREEMEADHILVDIACKFINYRVENNMTQKELAKKLEMTQVMVSKLESGDYNPSVKMLFEISKKLHWKLEIKIENTNIEMEPLYSDPSNNSFDSDNVMNKLRCAS